MDDRSYDYLKRKVLALTGINLNDYKSQQMRRRLDMFVSNTRFDNIVSYFAALEKDEAMLRKLTDFLTINVSEFFRDKPPYDYLQNVVLPKLLREKSALNIWSAGCSHGQECFSIAMILNNISFSRNHRILATDIDEGSLKIARNGGPYTPGDLKNVPEQYLKRYFIRSGENYFIQESVRKAVEVRQQNLLTETFEVGFDLIICRNVTIYFTEEAKRTLNKKFHHSLRAGGFLFIGGTEVMLDAPVIGFKPVGISFYQKIENAEPLRISPLVRNGQLVKIRV
jgi:chemotaxis protein methyltransferase CheR